MLQKVFVIASFFLAAFAQLTIGASLQDLSGSTAPQGISPTELAKVEIEQISPQKAFHPFLSDDIELVALCFHHVDAGGIFSVESDQLKTLIMEFADKGYTFIDADDLLQYDAMTKTPPSKLVMLTFDDGYVDNYTVAAPILKEFGVKGTFFISTDKIGKQGYVSKGQVQAMSDMGFAIGSHTVTHPNLSQIDLATVASEFEKSKQVLEEIIGKPVRTVAYPGGEVNKGVVETAGKYYSLAFLATSNSKTHESNLKINRWGVFDYNWTFESIKANEQQEIKE